MNGGSFQRWAHIRLRQQHSSEMSQGILWKESRIVGSVAPEKDGTGQKQAGHDTAKDKFGQSLPLGNKTILGYGKGM